MIQVVVSVAISLLAMFGAYKYVPLQWLDNGVHTPTFGSTITTINGGDTLSSSRSVINTNFTNLNNDKMELTGTTLSNLAVVGTITSGTWTAGTIGVPYGGTGSTTLSQYSVLLGNGAGNISTVNGLGVSGTFLQSQGAGAAPQWVANAIDQAGTFNWTGIQTFVKATTTNATSTSLQVSGLASTTQLITGALGVGISTSTQRNAEIAGDLYVHGNVSVGGNSSGNVKFLATPVNSVRNTSAPSASFVTVDVTSTTTPDIARFAIISVTINCTYTSTSIGIDGCQFTPRKNGGTAQPVTQSLIALVQVSTKNVAAAGMFIVPLDANQQYQYQFANMTGVTPSASSIAIDMLGYIK